MQQGFFERLAVEAMVSVTCLSHLQATAQQCVTVGKPIRENELPGRFIQHQPEEVRARLRASTAADWSPSTLPGWYVGHLAWLRTVDVAGVPA